MRYVFVYGTLRAGEINDINVAAARHAIAPPRLLGRTSVAGRLFDFGAYPGMVAGVVAGMAADAGAASVLGDVYETDEALVPVLDRIEEVAPAGNGLFVVDEVSVDVQGRRVRCLFYPVGRESVHGRPEIEGGDWIAYRLSR